MIKRKVSNIQVSEEAGRVGLNNLLSLTSNKETEEDKVKRIEREVISGVFE